MEPSDGLASTNYKAGSVSGLQTAISSVFSRWDGLQMAIQNQWGGRDSHQKSLNLASDVFSWFSRSKPPLYVEDLENLLHESLLLSFNTEIEDGSIEQVAEQLMMIYEEHLQGSR
ncbi:pre-rRNA-processing protein TSR2 homolog [Momordica charantia]|uniref:Pre-rRNA-processing protein TSR2 homolog n=1 Tax=Momordica charantia TaxID=3673 RepID=A0A6J1C959_MOMCH|nr:pre-rRNA-processing protein TSR2 homolog [Momordica charantia]